MTHGDAHAFRAAQAGFGLLADDDVQRTLRRRLEMVRGQINGLRTAAAVHGLILRGGHIGFDAHADPSPDAPWLTADQFELAGIPAPSDDIGFLASLDHCAESVDALEMCAVRVWRRGAEIWVVNVPREAYDLLAERPGGRPFASEDDARVFAATLRRRLEAAEARAAIGLQAADDTIVEAHFGGGADD